MQRKPDSIVPQKPLSSQRGGRQVFTHATNMRILHSTCIFDRFIVSLAWVRQKPVLKKRAAGMLLVKDVFRCLGGITRVLLEGHL